MKICPNCQHANEATNDFCENCGADLSQVVSQQHAQARKTGKVHGESRQNQGYSRADNHRFSWLKIGGSVLVIILIAVIGFGYHQYHAGKDQQIAAVVKSMTGQKQTKLVENLVSDNADFKISKQSVQPLLTYIQKHPQYARDLKMDLQHNGHSSDYTFVVKQVGTKWTLFPTFKLRVTTMEPLISTNLKNATLEANGTDLVETKNAHATYKVGPLCPGTYRFKLSNSDRTITHKVNLMGRKNTHELISLVANEKSSTATTANADTTTDTDSDSSALDTENSTESDTQSGTGSTYDDLSSSAQTAVSKIAATTDSDVNDYDYTESEPYTDVYEIKCYTSGTSDLVDTYRYDDVHGILALYNSDTGKFETVDTNE